MSGFGLIHDPNESKWDIYLGNKVVVEHSGRTSAGILAEVNKHLGYIDVRPSIIRGPKGEYYVESKLPTRIDYSTVGAMLPIMRGSLEDVAEDWTSQARIKKRLIKTGKR